MDLGKFTDSEKEFRAALLPGETPAVLHALGVVLMYRGEDQGAIEYISRALQEQPEKYVWWMNKGIALRRVHQLAESEHANRRGLNLVEAEINKNTRDGYARSCLAYLCARLKEQEPDRAGFEIRQALHDSPKDADVRFNAVATYVALDQQEDAIKVLMDSPTQVLADVSRFPDLADLRKNSRFLELLASHGLK
jgi:Flp pilus assembly protein TadD